MASAEAWPELEAVRESGGRELVLHGPDIARRVEDSGGRVPASLWSLTRLNLLDLTSISLAAVPAQLRNLASLGCLVLRGNLLQELPSEIGQLTQLKLLDVSNNQLPRLPDSLCLLRRLETLNAGGNHLSCVPPALSGCPALRRLNLSHNRLCADALSPLLSPPPVSASPSADRARRAAAGTAAATAAFPLLEDVTLRGNRVDTLPGGLAAAWPAIKSLDLADNLLSEVPRALLSCTKLKSLAVGGNPFVDRHFARIAAGPNVQTRDLLGYMETRGDAGGQGGSRGRSKRARGGGRKAAAAAAPPPGANDDDANNDERPIIRIVRSAAKIQTVVKEEGKEGKEEEEVKEEEGRQEEVCVGVSAAVLAVRPYLVACLVRGLQLKHGDALRRFLTLQTELHESVCKRRTLATIATHDLRRVHPPLLYDARPPTDIQVSPLGGGPCSALSLVRSLQASLQEKRRGKNKHRSASGLQQYAHLLDGHACYPCLLDRDGAVISLPPITNSDITKVIADTSDVLVEVTSSQSLAACTLTMDSLITKIAEFHQSTLEKSRENLKEEQLSAELHDLSLDATDEKLTEKREGKAVGTKPTLEVMQVRVVNASDGSLRVIYPSRTDLHCPSINVQW